MTLEQLARLADAEHQRKVFARDRRRSCWHTIGYVLGLAALMLMVSFLVFLGLMEVAGS